MLFMKNLKKLSRNDLKMISGGKILPGGGVGGYNCTDACTPGDNFCAQYGLTCGLWAHTNPDGTLNYGCFKCL